MFQKKLTEKRFEKDYIINDLKQIEEEINHFSRHIETTALELEAIMGLLNKLNMYIDKFSKTVEIFEVSCIDTNKLTPHFNSLYNKTTDVSGKQLLLDEANKHEINTVCTDFIITTRQMIFSVNKH